jgi:hypothetical protein
MRELIPFRKTSDWFATHALLSTLVVLQWGCAPWHQQTVVPPASTPFDSTKTYRVTLSDGRRQVIYHPRVSGDSLTWVAETSPDVPRTLRPQERRAIPLSDIHAVEVEGSNGYAAVLVLLVGIGVLGAVAAAGAFPHQ